VIAVIPACASFRLQISFVPLGARGYDGGVFLPFTT